MANVFAVLPVPAGVGVGAAVSVATMAVQKTLIISADTFDGALIIEASQDAVNFAQLASLGGGSGVITLDALAVELRCRINRIAPGASVPTSIDIGAVVTTNQSGAIPVPAVDGPGGIFDSSAHGPIHTFIVTGPASFAGGLIRVEGSGDGVNFSTLSKSFTEPGVLTVAPRIVSDMRVVAQGFGSVPPAITVGLVSSDG